MTRRSLLGMLVTGASLLVSGIIGVPALIAGLSPLLRRRPREDWRPLGQLEDFSRGAVSAATYVADPDAHASAWPRPFTRKSLFVWRPSEAELVVFSRTCTDLGCALNHDPASGCYLCPCHGGIFDRDGQRLSGPPNKPMYRYAHRVRDGVLEVDLASIPPSA